MLGLMVLFLGILMMVVGGCSRLFFGGWLLLVVCSAGVSIGGSSLIGWCLFES